MNSEILYYTEEEWAPIELEIRKRFKLKDPTPITHVEGFDDSGRKVTLVRKLYRKEFERGRTH